MTDLEDDFRIEADTRDNKPGWKFNEWEMKGVPLRLELGPRDVQAGQAVLVRHDKKEKKIVKYEDLKDEIRRMLADIQKDMFNQARQHLEDNTRTVDDYEEFKKTLEEDRGFLISPWCGSSDCEEQVKTDTMATIRCIPHDKKGTGSCLICGKKDSDRVYFARAY